MIRELAATQFINDASLVEYYRLEDVNGLKGLTLTNNGTTTFATAKFGNGADFGANNTTKSLSSTSTSFSLTNLTISCWIKVATFPTSGNIGCICSKWNLSSKGYDLRLYNNAGVQQLQFFCQDAGPSYNHSMSTGEWHHIAATNNNTTSYLYIDGISIANAAAANPLAGTGSPFSIGAQDFGSGLQRWFSGMVDDYAIFSRALTASEIYEIGARDITIKSRPGSLGSML